MNLADAVARAEKEGMRLPMVDEPFVKPPADSSKSWQDHPDGGERTGMAAARAAEGLGSLVDRRHIVKAASLAPVGLMALSLLVLHAAVKLDVVSYQSRRATGSAATRCCRARRSCAPWRASLCCGTDMMRARRCIG